MRRSEERHSHKVSRSSTVGATETYSNLLQTTWWAHEGTVNNKMHQPLEHRSLVLLGISTKETFSLPAKPRHDLETYEVAAYSSTTPTENIGGARGSSRLNLAGTQYHSRSSDPACRVSMVLYGSGRRLLGETMVEIPHLKQCIRMNSCYQRHFRSQDGDRPDWQTMSIMVITKNRGRPHSGCCKRPTFGAIQK